MRDRGALAEERSAMGGEKEIRWAGGGKKSEREKKEGKR